MSGDIMAKIYENKEDFERDKLKEQSGRLNNEALKQGGFGVSLVALSAILSNWFSNTRHKTALAFTTIALDVVGVVEVVRSWMTHSKARDLKLEHERMGHGTEVHLFNDPSIPNLTMNNEKSCCWQNKYTQNIQPTSLMEQAAKAEGIINHK